MDGAVSPIVEAAAPRRRFTGRDVERMVETGVIGADERLELIHGDLIDMGREGTVHWRARALLINGLIRRLPETIMLAPDGPLRLAEDEEPEPDFYLFPAGMDVNDVRGPDALLVAEITDSSLAKDKDIKGPLYAAHGVREYWIIDVASRTTLVHRHSGAVRYPEPEETAFEVELSPAALPGLRVKIADFCRRAPHRTGPRASRRA